MINHKLVVIMYFSSNEERIGERQCPLKISLMARVYIGFTWHL